RFELVAADQIDVFDRTLGRLRHRDEAGNTAIAAALAIGRAGRAGNRAGEDAADLKIGAGGAGGADAEEARLIGLGDGAADERRRQQRESIGQASAGARTHPDDYRFARFRRFADLLHCPGSPSPSRQFSRTVSRGTGTGPRWFSNVVPAALIPSFQSRMIAAKVDDQDRASRAIREDRPDRRVEIRD